MARHGLAALPLLGALLALASPAAASTFYVDDGAGSSTLCTATAKCNLISEAIARERATPEADTIVVDAGTYTQTINLDQAADAGLVIQGAGSGGGAFDPATQTIVRATSASGTAQIRTIQDDVVLRGLRLDVPSPYQRGGLDLLASRVRVEDVLVELNWSDSAAVAINTSAAKSGIVLDRVRVAAPPASRGVLAYAASMVIADSQIASGQQAVELLGPGLTIARSRLSRGGAGAVVFGSAQGLVIDSSLLTGGGTGLELYAPDATTMSAQLRGVTIDAGEAKVSDPGLAALRARADSGAGTVGTATITATDSILVESQASEGSGVGQITCLFSDAPSQAESTGADFVSCPGNAAGNSSSGPGALFAAGADWHLLPGSPAIDGGSPAALAGGESATDLDANPRLADGNLDCLPRRDKGAYELTGQSAPCPPNPAPVVRGFSLTNKVFRAAGGRASASAKRPTPVGTTFRWRLSEAARVRIAVERQVTGRRAGGRCRKETPKNRKARKCTLYTASGALTARGKSGKGSKRYDGRLRRKALPPGNYRGVMVATDSAGQRSKAKRVAFKIVRR